MESAEVSPALAEFLQAGKQYEDVDSMPADLSLGELDITTDTTSLKGLDEQIAQFAEHDVLKAILDQGQDPKEYRREYEAKLRQVELESIQDYISESDNLVTLHDQISTCDAILASMEGMLGKFQSELGNISSEIRALQEQSQSMSVKLKNRKQTEQKLGAFVESIALPAALIEGVVHREVDEAFLDVLQQLHRKLEFVENNDAARDSAAFRDVAPELERLRFKAIGKTRDFLMAKVYNLRKPKTNIQILQQNVLLKYKYLVTFLRQHGREVFGEVRAAYVDTLSRVLSSHFRSYLMLTEKLQEDVATQQDVLGAPDSSVAGVMGALFARATQGAMAQPHQQHRADVFALADRGAILHHLDAPAIVPHVVEAEGKRFPYEVLFRSVNKLLLDTATSEYLFCAEFFQDTAVFNELFGATLSVVEGALSATLQETYDMVCVLLLIRINGHHQLIMNKRRIPCLDDYLDRLNLMLWPRFKALFDTQLNSIKQFSPASFSEDVRPHFITQRYAQLTATLIQLNAAYQDGQLSHNIDRMRHSTLDLLGRLARSFSTKKLGTIFLILNHTHIVTVLRDAAAKPLQLPMAGQGPATASGGMPMYSQQQQQQQGQQQQGPGSSTAAVTLKEFEDQLLTCTVVYVEDQLGTHFGGLIAFVKKAEVAAKQKDGLDGQAMVGFGPTQAAPIVKDFANRWQTAIETLHRDTMRDFKNSTCGRDVLQAAMTQLLLYYTRLLELLKKAGPDGQAVVRDAVTVPSIMYEIKRYNRA